MVKLKAFEYFSSTFHGKFYFQGLFKTVLSIQVLFKPVRTLDMHFQIFLWSINKLYFGGDNSQPDENRGSSMRAHVLLNLID